MTQPTLQQYKLDEIAEHPDNPRDKVGDVTDLANSISEVGLLEPLVVVPAPDDLAGKKYGNVKVLLIAGHRRLAAAVKAKVADVPAILRTDLTTRAAQIEAMLVENLHRADLSPVEEAHAYQLLLDIGDLTQTQLAQHVGQPKSRVRDRLKLAKLPDGVQTRIHAGQVNLGEALAMAEFADDEETLANLDKAAGTSNFEWYVKRAKDDREKAKAYAVAAAEFRASGVRLLANAPGRFAGGSDADQHPARLEWFLPDGHETAWGPIAKRLAAEKDLHGDCPERAVFLDDSDHTIAFYCMTPFIHRAAEADMEDTDLPQTPEELEARKAEQERRDAEEKEREQRQANLDAAAAVRREHVANILHAKGNVDLAKRLLIRWLLEEGNDAGLRWYIDGYNTSQTWPLLATLLRLDPQAEKGDRLAMVQNKLNTLSLPALTILASTWWSYDTQLAQGYVVADEALVDWIHALTDDLAHEWTDFERSHLGLDADGHVATDEDEGQEGAA